MQLLIKKIFMPVFNMVRDNSNPFKAGHIEKNVTGSRFWSLCIKEIANNLYILMFSETISTPVLYFYFLLPPHGFKNLSDS